MSQSFECISSEAMDSMISFFNPTTTWADIKWLKTITTLPVVLKGILTKEDALMAVECGVQGIVVSNHGGRQLNGSPAAVTQLLRHF